MADRDWAGLGVAGKARLVGAGSVGVGLRPLLNHMDSADWQ